MNRIAIIGAGGIGGYLAHLLAAAGQDVSILARGAHLAAIRADGLTLADDHGETTTVRPALATDDAAEIGEADLAIFAVKAQDMASALEQARPIMGERGVGLSFLNGVEGPQMIADAHGRERALIGIARVSSTIEAPGRIRKFTPFAGFTIGDMDGRQDRAPVPEIRESFQAAGIRAPAHADVIVDLWAKFVGLSTFAALTAGARCDIAAVRANPELLALADRLIDEAVAVARARGIELPDEEVEGVKGFIGRLEGGLKASLAHDLAAGKRLETDFLSGAVARLGAEVEVDAPAHRTVAALLAPWREGGG